MRELLQRGPVDSERVAAAPSVHILAGVTFTALFAAPGAPTPVVLAGGRPLALLRIPGALYFRFVTLATLGYWWCWWRG